jgi:hypothetical protein
VPLLLFGPPFFHITLFLVTGMTGISLHMQWPLTSQSHGSFLKDNYCLFAFLADQTRCKAYNYNSVCRIGSRPLRIDDDGLHRLRLHGTQELGRREEHPGTDSIKRVCLFCYILCKSNE